MASVNTYTTTLVEAIGTTDDQILVASATGITNPDSLGGNSTAVVIQIDNELMFVAPDYKFGHTLVPVVRGADVGPQTSNAQPHAAGATVTITAYNNLEFTH